MRKVSGLIICKNEEHNIEECVKSILWCDEIIIADSYSTDGTLEILKKYPVSIYQNEWKGFSKQREFAVSKVNHEWIFSLDADERCSPGLASEIKSVLNSGNLFDGYMIPRKSFFLGKWIKHCGWYPGYQMRLFNRKNVTVTDRLVHEGYLISGSEGKLVNDILHYTVRSVSDYTMKINNYSSLEALEKADGKKISAANLFFKPILEFKKKFFFQGGYRDGIYGLMVSYFHMMTKILTYMKIREIQNKSGDE
ncbi:MAG: glycosyltransferase family 2 protein [Ignavibacteria bacterium]|nr:glycosyltransferase family 2 protein [Ignavibacteria bacterium]